MELVAQKYQVAYAVNAYRMEEGIPYFQPERVCKIESETDDLRYLFRDLTEMHIDDNVMGIRILEIQKSCG